MISKATFCHFYFIIIQNCQHKLSIRTDKKLVTLFYYKNANEITFEYAKFICAIENELIKKVLQ